MTLGKLISAPLSHSLWDLLKTIIEGRKIIILSLYHLFVASLELRIFVSGFLQAVRQSLRSKACVQEPTHLVIKRLTEGLTNARIMILKSLLANYWDYTIYQIHLIGQWYSKPRPLVLWGYLQLTFLRQRRLFWVYTRHVVLGEAGWHPSQQGLFVSLEEGCVCVCVCVCVCLSLCGCFVCACSMYLLPITHTHTHTHTHTCTMIHV